MRIQGQYPLTLFRCIQTGASHPIAAPALTCAFGHTVPHAALMSGLPASSDIARLPAPWSALHGQSFLAVGRWTRGTNGLRSTELTPTEVDPLRRAEWARARDLFYRFVARDQATQIVLERVVYLDNPTLEVDSVSEIPLNLYRTRSGRPGRRLVGDTCPQSMRRRQSRR